MQQKNLSLEHVVTRFNAGRRLRIFTIVAAIFTATRAAAAPCESLTSLALPHTTITLAEDLSRGTFTPPDGPPGRAITNLPAFCRVAATLKPTPDSDIRIEVWLPAAQVAGGQASWNGKLQSVGNGAWAGVIPYPALAAAVTSGYATAGTDTGHAGNNARFAAGHPEKLTDYGYRAVHEMTVAAKSIIAAFYGNGPRLSYWNSCSTGGRQGLMEAQRFPRRLRRHHRRGAGVRTHPAIDLGAVDRPGRPQRRRE